MQANEQESMEQETSWEGSDEAESLVHQIREDPTGSYPLLES